MYIKGIVQPFELGVEHRIERVLKSSELGPLTRRQVCPPFGSGGAGWDTLAGEGMGGHNSYEGTDTVVL